MDSSAFRTLTLVLLGACAGASACLGATSVVAPTEETADEPRDVASGEETKVKVPASYPVPRTKGKDFCGKPLAWDNLALVTHLPGLVADLEAVNPRKRGICVVDLRLLSDSDPEDERPARKPGGYSLVLRGDRAIVRGADKAGLRNGLIALGRRLGEGSGDIARGTQRSAPLHTPRALHLVIRAKPVDDVKRTIDYAMWNHYDTLLFRVGEAVSWDALKPFTNRRNQPKFRQWSKDELKDVTEYAKARGFEVIPELKMLTHQGNFLGPYRPDLLIVPEDLWDPRMDENYKIAGQVIDEIVAAMAPTALHIGHDEVHEWYKWQKGKKVGSDTRTFTAEDFLLSVRKSHALVTGKKLKVWMWGDMLQYPARHPKMRPQDLKGVPEIHAGLKSLPKDIVICDWHYKVWDGPYTSTVDFESQGFRALGAVFRHEPAVQAFSADWGRNSKRGGGMIQTTWILFPRSDWAEVERMVRTGGDAFWGGAH